MSCIEKRFFGVELVPDEGSDLSPHWAEDRSASAVLVFAGRSLLWRLVRNKGYRRYFGGGRHYVVPVEPGASRQIRWATGCPVGPFPEFQTIVRMLSHAESSGAAVYLLGRSTDELQRIEQNIRVTFPGVRVVGRAVFHPISIASVTTAIRKSAPRIVLSSVTSSSFLRWMLVSADRIGPTLTVLTPGGLGRMAGKRRTSIVMSVLSTPVRLLLPIPLVIHRLVLRRKKKKRVRV
ncbi:MAG: WecB/TagA/CpsF family glycosyltransferase [Alkalispirochaeta sp.]|jgi:N-acetylglucosaminyldiphosphoundecaprenol N-acetyl-beta-D-mannosaminyltransferase